MVHWLQMVNSGEFQKFDFGATGNLKHYGTPTPPLCGAIDPPLLPLIQLSFDFHFTSYNISQFPKGMPVAFYIGGQDELADPTDVAELLSVFPSKPHVVSIATYSHLDFVWALDASKLVYADLINFFESIN